jgi:hypothetical protein
VRTVGTEVRSEAEPERVDFHFPVEIYLEQGTGPSVDLETLAEDVLERLARRLT